MAPSLGDFYVTPNISILLDLPISQHRSRGHWYFVRQPRCFSLTVYADLACSGPLIIKGFGYDARQTSLLNMPFGVVQAICCLSSAVLAARFGRKGLVLLGFIIPCLIGSGLLYGKPL